MMTTTLNALPQAAAGAQRTAAVLLPYIHLPDGARRAVHAIPRSWRKRFVALLDCQTNASMTMQERGHDA